MRVADVVGSGGVRVGGIRGRVLGGVREAMIDFEQQWRNYVATLNGPKMTTTIELDDDSDTFTVDSVQRTGDGFLIDAHDEDGEPWVFNLRLTGDR